MSTRSATVYEATEEGFPDIGTITLSGEEVTAQPRPGGEVLVASIMENDILVGGRVLHRDLDPVDWFDGLPLHYRGSRLFVAHAVQSIAQKMEQVLKNNPYRDENGRFT